MKVFLWHGESKVIFQLNGVINNLPALHGTVVYFDGHITRHYFNHIETGLSTTAHRTLSHNSIFVNVVRSTESRTKHVQFVLAA